MGADVAFLGFIKRIADPRKAQGVDEAAELEQVGRRIDASVRGIEDHLSLVQDSLARIESKLGTLAG
ncbi:MAG TPA: hypothetical protein VLQ45_23790 [Thermoanaerobaculia bacterium]|nr:hypothetical protein [Thermoanaerobaculia bacterium]